MTSISVVMAVYNGQQFLAEQLTSVLAQLQAGDELIAIDDASTDRSQAILRGCDSPLVRIVANSRNLGASASFGRGLSLARNEFIFLCDQDDLWCDGKRAAFLEAFADDPSVALVISDAEVIDGGGALIADSFMSHRGGFRAGLLATLWRNRYLGCALAVRRSVLRAALPIPRWAPMHDMWLGVIAHGIGHVVYLPRPYTRYRRHDGNLTPLRTHAPWSRLLRWRLGLLAALLRRRCAIGLGLHRPVNQTSADAF